MKDDILNVLNVDPLSEAENITGKSYKEDEATSAIGMFLHLSHSKLKKSVLEDVKDTLFSISLSDYISIIEKYGFTLVYSEDIPDTPDKFFIYWKDGLLLKFDSYFGNRVNGGDLYFQLKVENKENQMGVYKVPCSSHWNNDVFIGNLDCREGLITKIEYLSNIGTILNDWVEVPFLWLLNYNDTKIPNYDHKAITLSKLAKLPDNVKLSIGI